MINLRRNFRMSIKTSNLPQASWLAVKAVLLIIGLESVYLGCMGISDERETITCAGLEEHTPKYNSFLFNLSFVELEADTPAEAHTIMTGMFSALAFSYGTHGLIEAALKNNLHNGGKKNNVNDIKQKILVFVYKFLMKYPNILILPMALGSMAAVLAALAWAVNFISAVQVAVFIYTAFLQMTSALQIYLVFGISKMRAIFVKKIEIFDQQRRRPRTNGGKATTSAAASTSAAETDDDFIDTIVVGIEDLPVGST